MFAQLFINCVLNVHNLLRQNAFKLLPTRRLQRTSSTRVKMNPCYIYVHGIRTVSILPGAGKQAFAGEVNELRAQY